MAKTKTPFLSLGSRGTVGGFLTSQKRGGDTILRSKPIPTDPYSLNQAYQRWDYRDYAHLWTLLSNAEKQIYRTKASRYHITGFSLWMREKLTSLPDIVARYHLDEKGGAVAYDSSKDPHNGIIIGASPIAGLIDGAYSFDGINDTIVAANAATSLGVTNEGTIEFFYKRLTHTAWEDVISFDNLAGAGATRIEDKADGITVSMYGCSIVPPGLGLWTPVLTGIYYHLALVANDPPGFATAYLNGTPITPVALTGNWDISDLYIGSRSNTSSWWNGIIDHLVIHSIALPATLIKRHSERRYPS